MSDHIREDLEARWERLLKVISDEDDQRLIAAYTDFKVKEAISAIADRDSLLRSALYSLACFAGLAVGIPLSSYGAEALRLNVVNRENAAHDEVEAFKTRCIDKIVCSCEDNHP